MRRFVVGGRAGRREEDVGDVETTRDRSLTEGGPREDRGGVSNHGNSQETFELRRCQCPARFDSPCAGVPWRENRLNSGFRAGKPMNVIGRTAVYNLRTIHPVFDIIWWR